MNKKTVFILGAGFSAQAGLPTMANFIEKAKDIGSDNLNEFLKNIEKFSFVKNRKNDLPNNIEEVFSILTADDLMNDSSLNHAKSMKDFIKKVIEHYTPKGESSKNNSKLYSNVGDWGEYIISRDDNYGKIFRFLSRVMQLKFSKEGNEKKCLKVEKMDLGEENSIITFNYDTLLENCIEILNSKVLNGYEVPLELYKLHGCVKKNNIVPPTFMKHNEKENEELINTWKKAYEKICNANRLIFIGYSLPKSDNYFRYILKSAFNYIYNLKEINIICKDEDGKIIENYDEFLINFKNSKNNSPPINKWEEIPLVFKTENNFFWVDEEYGNKIFG